MYTLHLFNKSNLKDIVALGYIFALLTSTCFSVLFSGVGGPGLLGLLQRTPAMLFWSWTNLLICCLHNQRHSEAIEEDRINKPWRPIPAKRITAAGTTRLLYGVWPLVITSAYFTGGLQPCLIICGLNIWYNEYGGADQPIQKNFLNAVAITCFLAGPLEVAVHTDVPLSINRASVWLFIISVAVFTTVQAQDFRDRVGDGLRGRRTLPLVIGDMSARVSVAVGVSSSSLIATVFWGNPIIGLGLSGATGGFFLYRLFKKRTVEADAVTWKLWPAWMISLFLMPVLGTFFP